MAITNLTAKRLGKFEVQVTATSSLTGAVYYYWFLDGLFIGVTEVNTRTVYLQDAAQAKLAVVDSNTQVNDPSTLVPEMWPGRRELWFVRSTGADHYLLEQQKNGGEWEQVCSHWPNTDQWDYTIQLASLEDLATYVWRIVPVDAAGNRGSARVLESERIVRAPDAPNYTISFDPGTANVTFSSA